MSVRRSVRRSARLLKDNEFTGSYFSIQDVNVLPSKLSQLDSIEVVKPRPPNNKAKKRRGIAILEGEAGQSENRPAKTKRSRRRPALRIAIDDIAEDQALSGNNARSSPPDKRLSEKETRVSLGRDICMPSCARRSLSGEFVSPKRYLT